MANDLSAYNAQVWVNESLYVVQANMVAASKVHRNFEAALAQFGDTVNTRKPATFTAQNKGATSDVTVQNASATNVQVVMNKHKEVTFQVFDIEQTKGIKNLIAEYFRPAAIAIAAAADADVLGLYTDISTNTLTPTTLSYDYIVDAETKLNNSKVLYGDRHIIVSSPQKGALSKDQYFIDASKTGNGGQTLRTGVLLPVAGFDSISMDQNVVSAAGKHHNLAFHRNAFAFVTRLMQTADPNTPGAVVATQSFDGLGMRVVYSYNPTKLASQVTVDIFYGVKTLDETFAVDITTDVP